jgi:hypothetical protein
MEKLIYLKLNRERSDKPKKIKKNALLNMFIVKRRQINHQNLCYKLQSSLIITNMKS